MSENPDEFFGLKQLAKKLKVQNQNEYQALRQKVEELERRGVVATDEKGRVRYVAERHSETSKEKLQALEGILQVTRRGTGYVRLDGSSEEVSIPPKFMSTAFHGDRVRVSLFVKGTKHGKRPEENMEGEIVKVLRRSLSTVVGTLERNGRYTFVVPDDSRISRDIYVGDDSDDRLKARHGDKVIVRLLPWEDPQRNPEGEVMEVLGESGDPRVEVTGVARSFGLQQSFPREVQQTAESLSASITARDLDGRLDYRNIVTVTIDPEDAKDFDDALSLELLPDGTQRLGVHIADVSHYVSEGSALDREAFKRGTSVYMVNEVIPMLPERLSNDLCSLRPDVDRLTFSVLMDLNEKGSVSSYQIRKSVIHSARRFTYEEVQSIIEAKRGEHAKTLLALFTLSKTQLQKRRKKGSIDFDTPEAKFIFDDDGLPNAIKKKIRLDAHRLVEECMLLANKTVARHVGRSGREGEQRPFIYRVHDVPDPEKLKDLANFVKGFGFSLNAKDGVSATELQKLLDRVKGSEVETLINEVALRSMAKAIYSERNIGHYGLAFKHYSHFTSPIRRYPDLVIHRLLHEYERQVSPARFASLTERIPEICVQSSARERVAVDAERTSVKVMQAEFMKRHIGDEFDGVIGGVTEFGMFVEINDLLVEGLVRVRNMDDDYYIFDEKQYLLRGRTRGRQFRLGDKVRVRVSTVNPAEKQIDFVLAD